MAPSPVLRAAFGRSSETSGHKRTDRPRGGPRLRGRQASSHSVRTRSARNAHKGDRPTKKATRENKPVETGEVGTAERAHAPRLLDAACQFGCLGVQCMVITSIVKNSVPSPPCQAFLRLFHEKLFNFFFLPRVRAGRPLPREGFGRGRAASPVPLPPLLWPSRETGGGEPRPGCDLGPWNAAVQEFSRLGVDKRKYYGIIVLE